MTKEDVLNKRKASYVVDYQDGNRVQKDCLVDLKSGEIDIGADKITGLKYDRYAKQLSSHVEFKGREFQIESIENKPKVIDTEGFQFQDRQPTMKTVEEIRDQRRNGWRP